MPGNRDHKARRTHLILEVTSWLRNSETDCALTLRSKRQAHVCPTWEKPESGDAKLLFALPTGLAQVYLT